MATSCLEVGHHPFLGSSNHTTPCPVLAPESTSGKAADALRQQRCVSWLLQATAEMKCQEKFPGEAWTSSFPSQHLAKSCGKKGSRAKRQTSLQRAHTNAQASAEDGHPNSPKHKSQALFSSNFNPLFPPTEIPVTCLLAKGNYFNTKKKKQILVSVL